MTSLGEPPLVVGTIGIPGLAALARQSARDRVVDIVEARFDLAPAAFLASSLPSVLEACGRIEETGTPVLGTIRLVADGGRFTEDGPRLALFEQALGVMSWVDVELESAIAGEVVARAHARGRRVIVSHHDSTGTPEVESLGLLAERARALGADLVKIATSVDSLEGHDRLVAFLRTQRAPSEPGAGAGGPLALIGMGSVGTPLRTYLPSVGSRLTYGFLDAVAAPGQLHAHELVRRLIADCPTYAAHRRRTGLL